MKRAWKRNFFAAALSAALTLSGCGGQEASQGMPHQDSVSQETGQREPTVLIYGTMNLDPSIEAGIGFWNQKQQEYRVEVKTYENSDTGRMQLNNDIVSGKGPDIFDLSDINVSNYAAKGVLADLYEYVDEEWQAELVPGVLKTYEIDGKLFGLPMGYRFETLMGKRKLVGNAEDWTPDKVLRLARELERDEFLMDALSPLGFLRAVFSSDTNAYVDWVTGECHFDGGRFRSLLETAASVDVRYLEEDEKAQRLADGSLLLERVYVSDLSEYRQCVELFGGDETSWVGFPSEQGGRTVLYARMPIGIFELSSHKDGAWEFISYLLGEEFQQKYVMFNFPLRRSVLRERMKNADGNMDETAEKLFDLICGLRCEDVSDENIRKIVFEESQVYFDGKKSVEDVIGVIQNRASVYIDENYRSRQR